MRKLVSGSPPPSVTELMKRPAYEATKWPSTHTYTNRYMVLLQLHQVLIWFGMFVFTAWMHVHLMWLKLHSCIKEDSARSLIRGFRDFLPSFQFPPHFWHKYQAARFSAKKIQCEKLDYAGIQSLCRHCLPAFEFWDCLYWKRSAIIKCVWGHPIRFAAEFDFSIRRHTPCKLKNYLTSPGKKVSFKASFPWLK